MGNHGFNREWAREFESRLNQHAQGHRGGQWGGWGPPNRRSGPPPWLTGIFGLVGTERQPRGPRARRGDVRVAILDVLAAEPLNGYQVIGQISERSGGSWRPSPGSIYPTISQLEDEGLIEADDERGRRTLRLTDAGREYLAANPDEVAAVWAPFEDDDPAERDSADGPDFASLKPELGRVMNAVWQIITTGSDAQRRAAIGVLVETRRSLYTILADEPGHPAAASSEPTSSAWGDATDDPTAVPEDGSES
jgi:DNA-binding PadR family transcriptional regulator